LLDVASAADHLLQLQQELQQLQALAESNLSRSSAAVLDVTTGAPADADTAGGSSGSSSSSSMLWAAKYAPAAAAHMCGNAAAVATFKQFLQDWAGIIRQQAAAAAAGAPGTGGKGTAGAAAGLKGRGAAAMQSESESSWFQSTRKDGASSLLDGQAEIGRCDSLAVGRVGGQVQVTDAVGALSSQPLLCPMKTSLVQVLALRLLLLLLIEVLLPLLLQVHLPRPAGPLRQRQNRCGVCSG
jgi:hypothetical protein